MNHITIPDLTKAPPRQGRELLGGRYAWLARLADKVRAQRAGTSGDYAGYCPLSKGYLDLVGVTQQTFDGLIDQGADDDDLVAFFDAHVSDEQRRRANRFILEENAESLERQDAQEGYV